MHNNYYFIRQLSRQISQEITGWQIACCFSQEKDELVIGFTNGSSDKYLRATFTSAFSALTLASDFHRARRNSINLFGSVLGTAVEKVVQHLNERSFHLELSNGQQLLFKLFGNRSNVVLFTDRKPALIFNNQLKNDWDLRLDALDRPLDFSREHFLASELPLRKLYPTFGDVPLLYLDSLGFDKKPKQEQWHLLQQVLSELENPESYRLVLLDKQLRLSLLPVGSTHAEFAEPAEALNQFVRQHMGRHGYQTLYGTWKQRLGKALQQTLHYIEKAQQQLHQLEKGKSYSQLADVLMANLHQIPARTEEVRLFNFYTDQESVFKLKQGETPQKLAERYYRKARQQPQQINRLKEAISSRELEALQLQETLEKLDEQPDYKSLKVFVQQLESSLPAAAKPESTVPFKVYRYMGFDIWVGRNAKNNDLLTQKFAHKDDLWLHAKDVAGSHVVVRHQAGKPFPVPLLEKAAQLAAWYSKRKSDSLCPVSYTPKKFVRKRKGAPAGEVAVDREKVLLVVPMDLPELAVS